MQNLVLLVVSLLLGSAIADGEAEQHSISRRAFNGAEDVTFQLYTKSNPSTYTALLPNVDSSLGHFSASRPTKFIIHGWQSKASKMASIKDAYLSVGDYNVVLVDWSGLAGNIVYSIAKGHVDDVGAYLATLLNYLVKKGTSLSQVHIAGHSLGAHVAGVAGNRVTGTVGRITGMDPALPLFAGEALADRLDSSDASFVEIIHTCGGLLGFADAIGHVDFYPNKGKMVQPGCGLDLAGSCSHSRSHVYFEESIISGSGFYGYKCSSWDNFEDGVCYSNSVALMGEYTDTSARGVYYLATHSSSPYAEGH